MFRFKSVRLYTKRNKRLFQAVINNISNTINMTLEQETTKKDTNVGQQKRPMFSWQQTMLRVKDPEKSVPYYEKNYGMSLIDKYDFNDDKFSLYFMAKLKDGEEYNIKPGTDEAHKFLWNFNGACLELTHNHGTEKDESFKHNNGNQEPYRGFGHIAFNTEDVEKSCEILEANNVAFQKKPNEGRMKGLAFALDPDGYWIEIVRREPDLFSGYNLSQTMLRVKDPKKSLAFYKDILGMKLLEEKHFNDFSLYFLASERKEEEEETHQKRMFHPVLELTHNHGTENDENFSYHNGNTEPKGFGHTGFLVDDLDEACSYLTGHDVKFKKRPEEGSMRGIAFVCDPDGYWVEVIQRNVSF